MQKHDGTVICRARDLVVREPHRLRVGDKFFTFCFHAICRLTFFITPARNLLKHQSRLVCQMRLHGLCLLGFLFPTHSLCFSGDARGVFFLLIPVMHRHG